MKLRPTSGHECGVHVRRVHQVSIDVKPEGSILLQETVTRSHWRCVVLLRPLVRPVMQATKDVACAFVLARSWETCVPLYCLTLG